MLYFINWPKFIVWLPFLLEMLGNMCALIICCPFCDVIDFEINHSPLIKTFSCITKISEKNVNISRTKRAFNMKLKVFFVLFKGFSIVRNCLRPDSRPLTLIVG